MKMALSKNSSVKIRSKVNIMGSIINERQFNRLLSYSTRRGKSVQAEEAMPRRYILNLH